MGIDEFYSPTSSVFAAVVVVAERLEVEIFGGATVDPPFPMVDYERLSRSSADRIGKSGNGSTRAVMPRSARRHSVRSCRDPHCGDLLVLRYGELAEELRLRPRYTEASQKSPDNKGAAAAP